MPQFDGKGPEGKGPLTGRGNGKCKDTETQSMLNSLLNRIGRGNGKGNGRGNGRGNK